MSLLVVFTLEFPYFLTIDGLNIVSKFSIENFDIIQINRPFNKFQANLPYIYICIYENLSSRTLVHACVFWSKFEAVYPFVRTVHSEKLICCLHSSFTFSKGLLLILINTCIPMIIDFFYLLVLLCITVCDVQFLHSLLHVALALKSSPNVYSIY